MTIKYYTKQYAGMLPKIFEVKSHFLRTFGGTLQVKDGIAQKDTFMDLKTTDTEVVIQSYNTGENVGFGTGTGNSSRFGPRREVKSIDTQVQYDAPLAIHDGIDDFTVNDIPNQAVAELLALHGEAWIENLNVVLGKEISDKASETLTGELTEDGLKSVFNEASKTFTNNKVSKTLGRVAYVTADVYNLLVDHKLTTPAKQSNADVSNNVIQRFKGFDLEELADEYFQGTENIMFAADNVGVAGIGIQVARALESEDFAGVALQAAAKRAKYIPEKNNKAILKAVLSEPAEVPAG